MTRKSLGPVYHVSDRTRTYAILDWKVRYSTRAFALRAARAAVKRAGCGRARAVQLATDPKWAWRAEVTLNALTGRCG